jgi:hypothetical protein
MSDESFSAVFASEIDPDFSPGNGKRREWGFSPWDRLSYPAFGPFVLGQALPNHVAANGIL